jgi:hypothetical protein
MVDHTHEPKIGARLGAEIARIRNDDILEAVSIQIAQGTARRWDADHDARLPLQQRALTVSRQDVDVSIGSQRITRYPDDVELAVQVDVGNCDIVDVVACRKDSGFAKGPIALIELDADRSGLDE